MPVNSIIAAGGRNYASPMDKYTQTRRDMNQERKNAMMESQVQQNMGIQRQEQQRVGEQDNRAKTVELLKSQIPLMRESLQGNNPQEQQAIWDKGKPGRMQQAAMLGLDYMPEFDQFNPQMSEQIVRSHTPAAKGKPVNVMYKGKLQNAIADPSGNYVDEVTRKPLYGATKAPTRKEEGAPGSFGGGYRKDTAKDRDFKIAIEAEEGLRNLGANVNRIKATIDDSPDYIGGTTGTIVKLINSGQMQFDQLIGARDPLVKANGNIDTNQLKNLSKSNAGWIRKAALQGDRVDSAILELAFTHAKILNNSGKISDADIKYAKDIIEGGADKAAKMDSLNNLLERGFSNYTKQRETRKGRGNLQQGWKDIGRNEIFGAGYEGYDPGGSQTDVQGAEQLADELLKGIL